MSRLENDSRKSHLRIEVDDALWAVQPASHLADNHHHHIQERHGDLAVRPQQVGEALSGAMGNTVKICVATATQTVIASPDLPGKRSWRGNT